MKIEKCGVNNNDMITDGYHENDQAIRVNWGNGKSVVIHENSVGLEIRDWGDPMVIGITNQRIITLM